MPRSLPIRIAAATEADLSAVAELAGVVWREHYPGIITHGQIDYMLEHGYSHEVLMNFVAEAGAGLLLAYAGDRLIGFGAYRRVASADELKVEKLYVHQEAQGQGVGSRLIARIEEAALAQSLASLILNVNKHNVQAIRAYEKNGFVIRESVVVDIGAGYVMDDYVMAKRLSR